MKQQKLIKKVKSIFDETDIYTLMYMPPMLGFPIYIGFVVVISNYLPYNSVTESLMSFATAILCFVMCIGSVAAVYKKELPWVMGKTYKGNFAVVSGIFGLIVLGIFGIASLIAGISALFR
jgi:hypothetical protein